MTKISLMNKADAIVIVKKIMEETGYDKANALLEFKEMREAVAKGENPEEILYELGLEPDYIFGLL